MRVIATSIREIPEPPNRQQHRLRHPWRFLEDGLSFRYHDLNLSTVEYDTENSQSHLQRVNVDPSKCPRLAMTCPPRVPVFPLGTARNALLASDQSPLIGRLLLLSLSILQD